MKKLKYNLFYIAGIKEYKKRNIYTLAIDEDSFSVDGLFKKKKFNFANVKKVKYGDVKTIKKDDDDAYLALEGVVALMDKRINRKLKYCLVIELEATKIIFADEFENNIKSAAESLQQIFADFKPL